MKQDFIINKDHKKLLLFFAGWGMDHHLLDHCDITDYDVAICYDYTKMNFDATPYYPYSSITLVAWSMGVWAASVALNGSLLAFDQKIAINGTLFPIDAQRGISPVVFKGTLEGLNESSLQKFYRRICLSSNQYERFKSKMPDRSIECIKTELASIKQRVEACDTPHTLCYDQAYIGNNDRIFLPANQQMAWQEQHTPCTFIPEAHYVDFNLFLKTI